MNETSLYEKIEKIINEKIRPFIMADGGNIKVMSINAEKGELTIKLVGSCATCPMRMMTINNFVEKIIKENAPEIKSLIIK